MKTIALLTNGPSLPEYWNDEKSYLYHCVIGINTAAWHYPVDIWCYLDQDIIFNITPEHELCINQGIAKDTPLFRKHIPMPDKVATYEGNQGLRYIPNARIIKLPWYGNSWQRLKLEPEDGLTQCEKADTGYTFPNALALAAELADGGPVDIYGMDITTEQDFAGMKGDRSSTRWKNELPWVRAAWQPHWRIFGNASEPVRQYITGKISYKELHKTTISEMRGGKTYYK